MLQRTRACSQSPCMLEWAVVTSTASNRNRVLVSTGTWGLRGVSFQPYSNYDFQEMELSGYNGAIKGAQEEEGKGSREHINVVLALSAVHSWGARSPPPIPKPFRAAPPHIQNP